MSEQFVNEQRIRALQRFAMDNGCSYAAVQTVILQDIAAALERISPPYGFESTRIPPDSETLETMRVKGGWQYVEAVANGLWLLHRPAPAPEDKETE